MSTLLATVAILATWVVYATLLSGLGRTVRQLVARERRVSHLRLSDFWVGLALLVVWLQLWNFVVPVTLLTWLPLAAVAALGFTGGALSWHRPARLAVLFVGVFAVAMLWLANLAIAGPLHVDSAGYHLSMLQWVQDHAAVPGLANLHTRLGYNSAEFLYTAALGVGPWQGQGYHLANGLLLAAVLAEVAAALYRVVRRRGPRVPDLVLLVIGSAVIDHFANGYQLTSPAPDLAAFIVAIMLAVYLMRAVDTGSTTADWTAAVALTALAPLMRVQLLAMTVLAVPVMVLAVRQRAPAGWRPRPWMLAPAGAFVALAWGSLMARGVVLSGYPLFPSTVGAVGVDWKVPVAMARGESDTIRAYARDPSAAPDQVLGSWDWVSSWWRPALDNPDLRYPLAVLAMTVVVALAAILLRVSWRPTYPPLVAVAGLVPVVAATLAWFVTAPDPRFNAGPMWVLAATSLCLVASSFEWRWHVARLDFAAVIVLGVAGVLAAHSLLVLQQSGVTKPVSASGEGVLGTITAPPADLAVFRTDSGLRLNAPPDGRCWDAPQPCTPMPMAQLRLRGDDLSSGFTIDGAP